MEAIKERISAYWTERTHSFKEQRIHELQSEKRELWEREIRKYIPDGRKLKVLDLGCGTGFFTLLFAAKGHDATGIDLTEHMIFHAKETAQFMGLPARFLVMDAENPSLPEEEFDVLVTRNLSWTLPDLPSAYKRWYRLLAPGGILLNFDADYCRYSWEENQAGKDRAHRGLSEEMLSENDSIMMELSAYQERRPQWDVQLLLDAGFEQITIDAGVWARIYAEQDEFYHPEKIFAIAAQKQ